MSNNKVCQWGLSPIGLRHMLTIVKKSRLMGAEVPKHRTEQHLVPCVLDTSHIADDIVQVTSSQLSEMLLNFILHRSKDCCLTWYGNTRVIMSRKIRHTIGFL